MFSNERNRILSLIESGQVTAAEAAQLLDALEFERDPLGDQGRRRVVRVRVTNLATNRQKINVVIPVGLIDIALRLSTRLVPQISGSALEHLLQATKSGMKGRLLDLQDLEESERVEIFAE